MCVFSFASLENAPLKIYCELSALKAQQCERDPPFLHLLRSDSTENKFPPPFTAHFRPLCMSARSPLVSRESASFFNYSVKKLFSRAQLKISLFIWWNVAFLSDAFCFLLSRSVKSGCARASGHASPDNISPSSAHTREKKQKAPLSNNIYTQWYQNKITFVPLSLHSENTSLRALNSLKWKQIAVRRNWLCEPADFFCCLTQHTGSGGAHIHTQNIKD